MTLLKNLQKTYSICLNKNILNIVIQDYIKKNEFNSSKLVFSKSPFDTLIFFFDSVPSILFFLLSFNNKILFYLINFFRINDFIEE